MVIVVSPNATAVIVPSLVTVAISGLEDVHVKLPSLICPVKAFKFFAI